jgi:hypothetical protein
MDSAESKVQSRVAMRATPSIGRQKPPDIFHIASPIGAQEMTTVVGLIMDESMPSQGASTARPACQEPGARLVVRPTDHLRPHPALAKNCPGYTVQGLLRITVCGDTSQQGPITINQDNYILEGFGGWHLACTQNRPSVSCLELQMTEEQALLWLVQKQGRIHGLNDFVRVLLAYELEPWFKERAKSNQRLGGQMKAASNLTQAERIDVRSEIAAAAGVSVGNVTKVKQLLARSSPELIDALRDGQIRIHKAWEWSKVSRDEQLDRLQQFRGERGITATINLLIARHRSQTNPEPSGLRNLLKAIAELRGDRRLSPLLGQIDDLLARIQRTLSTPQDVPNEE